MNTRNTMSLVGLAALFAVAAVIPTANAQQLSTGVVAIESGTVQVNDEENRNIVRRTYGAVVLDQYGNLEGERPDGTRDEGIELIKDAVKDDEENLPQVTHDDYNK